MSKIAKIFGGKQKLQAPEPLAPLPTRADPEIAAAKKRQAEADKLRKGRRSSILTSGRGAEDILGSQITRPEARGAKLLGQ